LKFCHLDHCLESAGARSILWFMDTPASKGWMVKVATAVHSGAAPVEQFYAAGYYRMNDAERAVQRRLMVSGALDKPIIAVRELSASEIQELKLLELEVRRYV
jgi:carboxylesterase type B